MKVRQNQGQAGAGNGERMEAMTSAAIILAAGKGTRMGSAPINKVAFDCAGVPVIRRIVRNMREGGVTRFVIVVGHHAESVMQALNGEPDILWAYQAEQKGTGHAAECGLKVLESIGFTGSVLISMGDKIVTPAIVAALLSRLSAAGAGLRPDCPAAQAVLGVQRVSGPTSRGHVIFRSGRPVCIVEHKDAVRDNNAEALSSPYVNAAFYAFDAAALSTALKSLKADNAQGELYLTDTIAQFAEAGALDHYVVENPDDMLTYSTRLELRKIARRFLRRASEFSAKESDDSALQLQLSTTTLLAAFVSRYGDRPCILTSAPGRINLMGRHIEHRGGSTNMMATNQRMTFVVAPREDDVIRLANLDPAFPEAEFRISDFCRRGVLSASGKDGANSTVNLDLQPQPSSPAATAAWLDYLESPQVKSDLAAARGHWMNYVKGAVLRFQAALDMPLCGMDILASGDIPVAAGLSSSSALVVATAEALVALNELNLTTREFVDLCGEAEWYVGSRGGAGDHAAMKCARAGAITHLTFKPFDIGEVVPFPSGCSVLVIDSGEQAKKSEGARETFNARIRDYETALTEVKRHYPELPLAYFRDLAFLPEKDRQKALDCLKDLQPSTCDLQPSTTPYGVALFGINECRRAEECLTLLKEHDYAALGEMMKASHDGDRLGRGEYECSTPKIDALCDRLNATPGVLGSQLVGAGLGGCVIALVEKPAAGAVLADLAKSGYTAFASEPAAGSRVEY